MTINNAEIHYFVVSVPNGVPVRYKLEPEKSVVCSLAMSGEDKNHQWHFNNEMMNKELDTFVNVPVGMADSTKKTEKDVYTLMIFNTQGDGTCKYKLTLSTKTEG